MTGRKLTLRSSISQVLGLIEVAYSSGGMLDASEVNNVTDVDLDILSHVIDDAEALGLLEFKEGNISLTSIGEKIAMENPKVVKKILRKQLVSVEPFKTILKMLEEKGEIDREEVVDIIVKKSNPDDLDEAFMNFIQWGLYTNIFTYDHDDEIIKPIETGGRLSSYQKRKHKLTSFFI